MSNLIRIEIQDQFGRWQRYTRVVNNPTEIKLGLQRALKQQLAQKSRKVRAVDDKTGQLIDLLQG
jgi:hypothetical protein